MKEYAEEFTSSEELQEKIELYFKRNDDVYFLEKIVGKREKLKEWFRIFFVSESGKEDLVRNRSAFKSLKVTLNRFLESYDNDISLNLINGLLSLATGDFNKKDGRDRLIKAMNEISKLSAEEKDEMFSSILLTSHSILENDQMEELSELLIEAGFNSMKELKKINRTYDDIPSYVGMISLINHSILESSSGGYPWEK
jgi:ATP-dependent DNA helicase RecQ